ncbi:putative E3 ubiquitin-protein ligase HERC4 [Dermatophagoides pteronyssinus]|uniref:putative E3 ubiquitin-protein ligase HERC4 n=1 Tax=Dermatophagoides pteronyssinus TaxID=6956 RepID=UPI003F667406
MLKVYCFGNTENGELGLGAIEDEHILIPRKQRLPFDRRKYSLIQLSSGRNHTLLLLKNIQLDQNVVFSCGSNDRLQLGRNGSRKKLEQIDGLQHHNIVKISCGSNHCLVLSEAGQLFSWGCNLFGQLGLGNREEYEISKPSLIKKLAPKQIIQISCGGNHCLALAKNGEVYSWGSNAFGQLGLGNSGYCLSTPMLLISLQWTPVRQIAAGGSHSAILSCTGAIYVWGKNEFGQLGLSDCENRCLPTLQKSLRNQKIAYINLGDEHSAALTYEGGLFTWGAGMYGQLGHGRNTNEVLPRKVFELMGVKIVQVSCGRCHTLVVSKQGRVYSFGLNGSGQLGIGNTCSKYLPISIRGPWSELATKDIIVRDNHRSLLLVDDSMEQNRSESDRTTTTTTTNEQTTNGSSSNIHQTSDSMMEVNEMEIISEDCEVGNIDNQDNDGDFIIEEPEDDRFDDNKQQQQNQPLSQAKFVCANDTVFDESNLSLQIDEYESDPDSDQEEGPNRLQYICKEIIAGKGDHSFVIAQPYLEKILPKDLRQSNCNDEIVRMNNQIFEQFSMISNELSIPLDIIDYIETIFTSIPAINASFLCSSTIEATNNNDDDDQKNNPKKNNERIKLQKFKQQENIVFEELINFHDGLINWQQAFHWFNMIEDAQNERINELIYQFLMKMIPNLPDLSNMYKRFAVKDVEKFKKDFPDSIDEEVMRIYQIIPLFHMFHMPSYCERSQLLITSYARSLNTLSERGIDCMKIWWYHMNSRFFKNLVEILKNSIKLNLYEQYLNVIKQDDNDNNNDANLRFEYNIERQSGFGRSIPTNSSDNIGSSVPKFPISHHIHYNLATCLGALKRLYLVNKFNGKISYKEFYIKGINDWFDLKYDYTLWKYNRKTKPNIFFLCNFPFIFDPPAKTIILSADSEIQQNSAAHLSIRKQILMSRPDPDGTIEVNPYIEINVRRDNIVEDTIHQLCLFSNFQEAELKKPFRVYFCGEEAVDAGRGMKKEFFLLVMKEMLDQKYGMFVEYKETNTIWFSHILADDDDVMYRLVGTLCGLAIYNQVIIDLPFPLILYKKILNENLELDDLVYLDPILTKNLKEILSSTYEPDEFNAIFGEMTFVITLSAFGSNVEYELCPDGKNRQLTYKNREEYVELYWKYLLIDSVKKQFDAFYNGFMKVLDKDVLQIFQAEELMQLVEGEDMIDWNELERATHYKEPFNSNHPTIRLFWKVFGSFSEEEKRKFLKFLTGSERIPITGVKSMDIQIQSMNVSEDHLPVAHTCVHILDLPLNYNSENREEIMRKKLLKACDYCIEFALI